MTRDGLNSPGWCSSILVERGDIIVLPDGRIGTVVAQRDENDGMYNHVIVGAHDMDDVNDEPKTDNEEIELKPSDDIGFFVIHRQCA